MSVRKVQCIEYKDGEGKYKEPYLSDFFCVYDVVALVMNEKMPTCKSNKVLHNDRGEEVDDALTKEQFEELCLRVINRMYVQKGSITENTVVHKAIWDRLIGDINTAWCQLKRDKSRYNFLNVRGYRIKIDPEETPEEVIREYQILAGKRSIDHAFKDHDREVFFHKEFGVKPLYGGEYKRHLEEMKHLMIKEQVEVI